MKRLLILSGKGGTGKTTTAAAFLRFSKARAAADCDVDAPNLHLVQAMKRQPVFSDFLGGEKALIDSEKCVGCGLCSDCCRFHAIDYDGMAYRVNDVSCDGCGVCVYVCPQKALTLHADVAGKRILYQENDLVFSTAKLKMGRGNSGKLVTNVKMDMLKHAPECDLAVVDGSPGLGCPVIASMSGMDLALVVAEPSLSGISDLERLVKTAGVFQMKLAVYVNKWDVSPEKTKEIERFCQEQNIPFLGKVPYDKAASAAINAGKSLADMECPARDALYEIYQKTSDLLGI